MYEGRCGASVCHRHAREIGERHAIRARRRRRRARRRRSGSARPARTTTGAGVAARAPSAGDERRHQRVGRGEHRQIRRRQRLIVHVVAVVDILVHRALDDLAARQLAAAGLAQRAAEIDPVEAQDHVGFDDQARRVARHVKARRERLQRMLRRKRRAGLDVGEHERRRCARPARRGARSPPDRSTRGRS